MLMKNNTDPPLCMSIGVLDSRVDNKHEGMLLHMLPIRLLVHICVHLHIVVHIVIL